MAKIKHLDIPYLPQLRDSGCRQVEDIVNILDEIGCRRSVESVNWKELYPYKPLTTFTTAHSGDALFVDLFVRCNYLRAENYENLSPVSQDSCVEFFVSPGSDGHYWNFEFNCIGTINASHRTERSKPIRLTDDELERVKRYPSCGNRPFRELEGLFTWNLLVVIPLDLIGVKYSGEPITMRGNFYKCASGTSRPHYLSWNPIETEMPDFHRPEFFGEITLL